MLANRSAPVFSALLAVIGDTYALVRLLSIQALVELGCGRVAVVVAVAAFVFGGARNVAPAGSAQAGQRHLAFCWPLYSSDGGEHDMVGECWEYQCDRFFRPKKLSLSNKKLSLSN